MRAAEVQQAITDRTVKWIMAHEDVPWHKPWSVSVGQPVSMSSNKPYRGGNVWILGMEALDHPNYSKWWGTYNKIAQLAGMVKSRSGKFPRWESPDGTPRGVRKGEHATRVYVWDTKQIPDPDEPKGYRMVFFASAVMVFNAAQADGLPSEYYLQPKETENTELPAPQLILDDYFAHRGPKLVHGGTRAFYQYSDSLNLDEIHIPERATYDDSESYYWVLGHEAVHSTGAPSRVKRPGIENFDHFGTEQYGLEELIAQMGAAILAAISGIENGQENSAAYVAAWLRKIKKDVTLVPQAAKLAQRAVDYITGYEPEKETVNEH